MRKTTPSELEDYWNKRAESQILYKGAVLHNRGKLYPVSGPRKSNGKEQTLGKAV